MTAKITEEIFKELQMQNKALLEEYKRKLEIEFAEKMKLVMSMAQGQETISVGHDNQKIRSSTEVLPSHSVTIGSSGKVARESAPGKFQIRETPKLKNPTCSSKFDVYSEPVFPVAGKRPQKKDSEYSHDGSEVDLQALVDAVVVNETTNKPKVKRIGGTHVEMMLKKSEYLIADALGICKKKRSKKGTDVTFRDECRSPSDDAERTRLPPVTSHESSKLSNVDTTRTKFPLISIKEETPMKSIVQDSSNRNHISSINDADDERVIPRASSAPSPPHALAVPPFGWTTQRVNEPLVGASDTIEGEEGNEFSHTKSEWENELARHIISVYATSKVQTDGKESAALLGYVDQRRQETKGTIAAFVSKEDPKFPSPMESPDGIYDDDDDGDSDEEVARKKKSKASVRCFSPTNQPKSRQWVSSNMKPVALRTPAAAAEPLPTQSDAAEGVPAGATVKGKFRSSLVVRGKDGEDVVVRGTVRCTPIWFASSGEVYTDWSDLPVSISGMVGTTVEKEAARLQANLSVLYEHRRFKEYVLLVESTLIGLWNAYVAHKDFQMRAPPPELPSYARNKERVPEVILQPTNEAVLSFEELAALWKKLIITTNALGIMMIEKKNYQVALDLLSKAEAWAMKDDVLPKRIRHELRAHVLDAFSYYFFSQQKYVAAFSNTKQAIEVHEKNNNTNCIAIGLLHQSAIECQLGRFKDAHKTLYLFLAMVEDGRLGFDTATAMQLSLVAVGYNNLAVVQMKLMVSELACKSSQNARKIARLCLSYSNRWLSAFERTHDMALEDVRYQLSRRPDISAPAQLKIIQELAGTFYDPNPPT